MILAGALALAYLATYGAFRATHLERYERDGRYYVLYPEGATWLYYLYRPLAYADGAITGVGTHLGPHLPDQH